MQSTNKKNLYSQRTNSFPLDIPISEEREENIRRTFLLQLASKLGILPDSNDHKVFIARFSWFNDQLNISTIAQKYNLTEKNLTSSSTRLFELIETKHGLLKDRNKGQQSYDLIWNKLYPEWLREWNHSYSERRAGERRIKPAPLIDIKRLLHKDLIATVSTSEFELLDRDNQFDSHRASHVAKLLGIITKAFYEKDRYKQNVGQKYFFTNKVTKQENSVMNVAIAALSHATNVDIAPTDNTLGIDLSYQMSANHQPQTIRNIIFKIVQYIFIDYRVSIDRRNRKEPNRKNNIHQLHDFQIEKVS